MLTMDQLADPADDPFALAAAEKPGCKLARAIDRELGVEFILAFAPGSRYFDVIADRQTMEITRTGAQPAIADLTKAPAA
jgi:hypothetical protein